MARHYSLEGRDTLKFSAGCAKPNVALVNVLNTDIDIDFTRCFRKNRNHIFLPERLKSM